jgi:N-methylhydantoinase A/oxoprolinase/acetone carboxylase beta subunit
VQVAADIGGTFTDLVDGDGRSVKVLSTPDDPARAVAAGLGALVVGAGSATGAGSAVRWGSAADRSAGDRGRPELLAHGTTIATNALLERRGAAVALVTTQGLADVIEIARQDRPSLYDQLASRPEPLVPRRWRHQVVERLAADGTELVPVGSVPDLDDGVEAVAVCLLHADINPEHERAVASVLRGRGLDVTCSHEVSPEMREYERTVTTVINAALRPRCRDYLRGLAELADEVVVMTSAGGLLPAADAAELPAALLLSGPAGGVRAGAAVAAANGFPDAITFDMGGTSTDVCLIQGGAPAPAAQREVGGFTVRFPALDVHTIGAGGGSIARLDPGGALVVGPESAGANPGPACYGRGGTEPTVTDANLVARRIPADTAFGGLRLDQDAARRALARAAVTADGVLAVVNANMEGALRAVSVERGVDPAGLALVAFGGAGPLHACALADALGMPAVIVPARAGVLSAVGLLTAPRRRDVVRSWPTPDDHEGSDRALADLAADAVALVTGDVAPVSPAGSGTRNAEKPPAVPVDDPNPVGQPTQAVTVETGLDCRYRGQSHELTVPTVEAFHDAHQRRNGYARRDQPVEVVALRAAAVRPPAVSFDELPAVERLRSPVRGPAVLPESDCTIWLPDGWTAYPGAAGAILLRRKGRRGRSPRHGPAGS